MSRRGENIHKRKDGRWEARYKKGINAAGAVVYGSVYAKTYREAKEKRQALLCSGGTVHTAKAPRFEEVLKWWLEDNRIRFKGATEYRYRCLIQNQILPELGNIRVDQITAPSINAFLAEKLVRGRCDGGGGLSPTYVRSIMLVLRSALRFAASHGLCQPQYEDINKPLLKPKELVIMCEDDQKKLEDYCLNDTDETKLGVLLSLYTGLRIGEVCALRWDNVDLRQAILHVRHTVSRTSGNGVSELILDTPKTASSVRDIPICSWLVVLLQERFRVRKSEYVVSREDTFVSPRTYEYRFHRILQKSGVPNINYHMLRHTFATRCIESGMDAKTLSELLGHSNVSITLNIYVHSSMDRKRTQLEKLTGQGAIICGQKSGL